MKKITYIALTIFFSLSACGNPAHFSENQNTSSTSGTSINTGNSTTNPEGSTNSGSGTTNASTDEDQDGFTSSVDCNDNDANINPDATEINDNAVDENCDDIFGITPDTSLDTDNDGDSFTENGGDCDDTNADVNPRASEIPDDADGLDENCDGTAVNSSDLDNDHDGFSEDDGDCDDTESTAFPGGTEVCDTIDNNCDGDIDNRATDASLWYADRDSDGFGDPATSTHSCSAETNFVADNTDCDDHDSRINTSVTEVLDNHKDENCDGVIETSTSGFSDVDDDGDGYCEIACADGGPRGDCNDTNARVNPSVPERFADGIDNDCDDYDFNPATTRVVSNTGSDTLSDGITPNTECLITSPCQTLSYVVNHVATAGENVILLGQTYSFTSDVSIQNNVRIKGGFDDSTGSVLFSPTTATTTLDFTSNSKIIVLDVGASVTSLSNLTLQGNAYSGTTDTYLLSAVNSSVAFDDLIININDGTAEGRAVSFAANASNTSDLTFELSDSTIAFGTLTDSGASTKAVYVTNASSNAVVVQVSRNTIGSGTFSGSSATTAAIVSANFTSGTLDLTADHNTITLDSGDTGYGILSQYNTSHTIQGNKILLSQPTMQAGLFIVGNASTQEAMIRDNIMITTGAATSYNFFLIDTAATILNNTVIQDSSRLSTAFKYQYSSEVGKTLDFTNNVFYRSNVRSGYSFYITGTLGSSAEVMIENFYNNSFYNASGAEQVSYYGIDSSESSCTDGLDEDHDGATDCDDSDCGGEVTCMETDCTNGIDDDGDLMPDCRDTDCDADATCNETLCNDGVDDDNDGAIDCRDGGCSWYFSCRSFPTSILLPAHSYSTLASVISYLSGEGTIEADNLSSRDPRFDTTIFTTFPHITNSSTLIDNGYAHPDIDPTSDTDAYGNRRVRGTVDIGAEEFTP